jgi:glycosyltransferase involved in cell wall biosynthesis
MVLGEAMAASLPVITTDVGAHAEAIEDGYNGFIVRDDKASLGDALEMLVDDHALRQRMGEAGRARAEDRFDTAKNARELVDFLESRA